jgi:hypothetical protein
VFLLVHFYALTSQFLDLSEILLLLLFPPAFLSRFFFNYCIKLSMFLFYRLQEWASLQVVIMCAKTRVLSYSIQFCFEYKQKKLTR